MRYYKYLIDSTHIRRRVDAGTLHGDDGDFPAFYVQLGVCGVLLLLKKARDDPFNLTY